MERDDQEYCGKSMNFRSRTLCIVKMVSMGFLLLSLSSCVAQQADLVKLEKDFKSKVAKLDQEKKNLEKDFEAKVAKLDQEKENLEQILSAANQAIEESQAILAQQKSEVSELVRARAEIKSDLRSIREENLAQLSGDLETESNRLQGLERLVDDLTQEVKVLEGDVKTRDQARVKEITTLRENVKKDFTQQNKIMSENLAGLRASLVEFKKTMAAIDRRLVGEQTRATAAETNIRNELEAQQAFLREALQQQDAVTHQNLENLAKSIVQLKTGLAKVGEQLGFKIDEHAQSLEKSDGRLKQVESQIPALSKKIKSDIEALRGYLDKNIRASIQSLAKAVEAEKIRGLESSEKLEGFVQTMSKATQLDLKQAKVQMAEQNQYVNDLNQSVVSAREVLDSMATMLGKRSDDQMQHVGKLSAQFEQMKQKQSSVLLRQDVNVQTLSKHLKEVTASLQSVVKSLAQVKTTLTSRLDQQNTRLEEQDQRLTETANHSVSPEKVNQELIANVQYMNQLQESLRQLQNVVHEIGSKLGGKVDGHESQLARLKQQIQQSSASLNTFGGKLGEKVEEHESQLARLKQQMKRASASLNTLFKRLKPLLQAPGLQ